MITEHDLQEAIAECQGQRNPNANTCIKLAAFYTIRNEMQKNGQENYDRLDDPPAYSRSEAPLKHPENLITYESGSDFSEVINGMNASDVWPVMDELMDILQATNIRLYAGVIQKLEDVR